MSVLRSRTALTALGLFVFLALLDGVYRSGAFLLVHPVCNPGIGLGLGLSPTLMWAAILLILTIVLSHAFKKPFGWENVAWGGVFIGGVTNAIDRHARGCVTDYLHVPFFPSFNLADIMIFLGVMLLGLSFLGILSKAKPYVS